LNQNKNTQFCDINALDKGAALM